MSITNIFHWLKSGGGKLLKAGFWIADCYYRLSAINSFERKLLVQMVQKIEKIVEDSQEPLIMMKVQRKFFVLWKIFPHM
jgi:hypothetical protein